MAAQPGSPGPGEHLRFGLFRANLSTGELWKAERKVRLQQQPFQVLTLLLQRPGSVVTREELQKAVWAANTFVEFDQGLNTAVRKIRRVLGDSAENPRFIETLPRKGYRFIAPVVAGSPEADAPAEAPLWLVRKPILAAFGIALGLIVALGFWLAWRPRPSPRPFSESRLQQITSDLGFTGFPALSRDGKLLAYASDRSEQGNVDIWVQQVGGGPALRLTQHQGADHSPDFSPDGRTIAFCSTRDGGGIYAVPALGGEARFLTKGGWRPRFSPGGGHVAYTATIQGSFDGSRIYVLPLNGEPARQLAPEFLSAASPVWTPDGNYLVFVGVHPKQGGDLWAVSLDGRSLLKLGAMAILKQQFLHLNELDGFLPDGGSLVFSAASGDATNLWRLPLSKGTWQAAGPAERLTFGVSESGASTVLPGRIVFQSVAASARLWELPVDADRGVVRGELVRLTDTSASGFDLSADGRKLVFRSDRSQRLDIFVKDLATREERAITDGPPVLRGMPRISPDGTRIAFSRRSPQPRGSSPHSSDIYIAPAGGGAAEQVCAGCGGVSSWSADGKNLLWVKTDGERATVHLLDLSTGQHRLVLEHGELPLYAPRFSRDNRWIAFKGDLDMQRTRIFVAPFKGDAPCPPREWIAVTEGRAWDDLPRWSPNGNLIYFTSDRDGFRCIWARRLDPRTKQPLGEPFAIRHCHQMQLSMSVVALSGMDLSLAPDKLVFPLAEVKGNVWMIEPWRQ